MSERVCTAGQSSERSPAVKAETLRGCRWSERVQPAQRQRDRGRGRGSERQTGTATDTEAASQGGRRSDALQLRPRAGRVCRACSDVPARAALAVGADRPRCAEAVPNDDAKAAGRVRFILSLTRARDELWLAGPPWCGLPRAHFASFVRRVGATRKVVDEPAFPLLKPPTGQPGAERQHWNLAAFPPPVVKDAEGNEVPPDEDAPPPELVRPSSR